MNQEKRMKFSFLILGICLSLSCNSQLLAQTQPCCSGVQGAQGPAGPQGSQGVPGPAGPQGIQGVEGPCCPNVAAFTSIYSLMAQTVPSGGAATFELVSETSPSFDLSMASTTGAVTVLQSGIYQVNWSTEGNLTPPFPAPVPSIAFALSKNGVLLPSTTAASFTNSPDTLANITTATAMVRFSAGDVVQLINTSTLPFNGVPNQIATTPVCSFRLNFLLALAL
jgi:hypothetical protein